MSSITSLCFFGGWLSPLPVDFFLIPGFLW
jgi:NADH:ubiquinone oxidoreductase subunit H